MRPPPRFMPPPARLGARWYLLSGSVNLAVLVALVWIGYQQREVERQAFDPYVPLELGAREVAMIFLPPQAGSGDGDAAIAENGNALELSRALAPIATAPVEFVSPPLDVPNRVTPVSRDSSALATAIGTRRRLGPSFIDGRVWKTPPLTDQERIEISIRVAQLDPVVRDRLASLLAEVPPDSFAFAMQQEWTKEIGGRKWGIDQQWIHLGGIKIPSALLALIPFPQGNIFAARDATRYEAIRREIIENARRQEDMEDIKSNIKALRERIEAERQLERERVARRDSVVASRDTIIP